MKYVILCDYGLDDACATLLLMKNISKTDSVDIVAVGGNDGVEKAFSNAKTLISNFDDQTNVTLVDTRSIKQNAAYLPSIHGNDSMGDIFSLQNFTAPVVEFGKWLENLTSDITLISLGPCTITKMILDKIKTVKTLLIMGGNVSEVPNFKNREFNHEMDVSAFADVVKHPHLIATLDTCRVDYYNFASRVFDGEDWLSRALARSVELANARHFGRSFVYDYICVDYLFSSKKWTVQEQVDPDGNVLSVLKYVG